MGTLEQRELDHERDDVRGFYSQFSGEVIIGSRRVPSARRSNTVAWPSGRMCIH